MLHQTIQPDTSCILFCFSLVWVVATDWKELIAWNGWKNIESEELLYKHILRRNTTHLSMSANTPLANGPLADAIGLDGNLDFVDDILEGIAHHNQLTDHLPSDEIENSPELHAFLSALQKPCSTLTGASIPEISHRDHSQNCAEDISKKFEKICGDASNVAYRSPANSCCMPRADILRTSMGTRMCL